MTEVDEIMKARKPISRTDNVAQLLREDILQGNLMSGQALIEAQMVERFDVSRNTAREAMHSLAHAGLVVIIPHRGTFVRSFSQSEIRELFVIRRLIECGCVRSAEPRVWSDLQAVFRATFAQAASAQRGRDWRIVGTSSLLFHRLLVGTSGSDQMTAFFDNICAQMRLALQVVKDEAAMQSPWLEQDMKIFEALLGGECEKAEEMLMDYLYKSEKLLLDLMVQQNTVKRVL